MVRYIVQLGDTLHFIALKFGTSPSYIIELNGLVDPNSIYPGQVLKLPLHNSHTDKDIASRLPLLRKGSQGPLVILAKTMLLNNPFGPIDLTSVLDTTSMETIRRLQDHLGIQQSGCVDEASWRALLNDTINYQTPPYDSIMVRSGILLVLSLDKSIYRQGDTINMTLVKMNLSGKIQRLYYNSGQRYDFCIAYPNGHILWRWSDDKAFTQATAELVLLPGQVLSYTESFHLAMEIPLRQLRVIGRNCSKQTRHLRLEVKVKATS